MRVVPQPESESKVTQFFIGAVLVAICGWSSLAWSHPGRLDQSGCHRIHKEFIYKSGKVAPRGEYHCHRLLSGERLVPAIILDGREILMDSRKYVEQDESEQESKEQSP